jgi:NADPH:quinone reductase-like Zn-dependent oxidoreductase
VIDYTREPLEGIEQVDAVINLVGGDTVASSYARVKPEGVAVTSNRPPDGAEATRFGIEAAFVQAERSCVAFGIPKEAISARAAETVAPLACIPNLIMAWASSGSP